MSIGVRSDQAEIAYQTIREGILAGRFRPGERLKEERIAKESGVSRTPVREALRWLEHEGVVTSEKRRGSRVAPLSSEQVSDLYELRARVEGFACTLAARRITDEQRSALRRAAEEFAEVIGGDLATDRAIECVSAANERLHQLIARTAGNPFLAASLNAAKDNPLVVRTYRSFTSDELARSAMFHELIVDAICRGDAVRAERLMMEHVLQARDAIIETGSFDTDQ